MSNEPSRKPARRRKRQPKIGGILGLGLDHEDGHKRITTGEKFMLVGGSEETHGRMTETMIKTFEELKRRDKQLESIDPRELGEIIHKATPN